MGKNGAAAASLPTASSLEGANGVLTQTNNFLQKKLDLAPLTSAGVEPNPDHPTHAWWLRAVPSLVHTTGHYAIVGMPCTDPSGAEVTKWMRFSGKTAEGRRGCVLVIVLRDYIVTVEQFRLPILFATGSAAQAVTTELPRCYTNGGLVQSLHDGALRRVIQRNTSIQDQETLAEVRTLLGAEVAALLPHVTLKHVESLGAYSEWVDDSMVPVDVVRIELDHPDPESLRERELGPAHMRIRLYPFAQLISHVERERLHMRDQMSLSGLALFWGQLMREGKKVRRLPFVRYSSPELEIVNHRGPLEGINARLTATERGHLPLKELGAVYPYGEVYELKSDPFFSSVEDGWEVLCARNRLPSGVETDYFMRFRSQSALQRWDTLACVVNGEYLLAPVSHHLTALAHKEGADQRAWCPRAPLMIRKAGMRANVLGRLLGDSRAHFLEDPNPKPVMDFLRGSTLTPGPEWDVYEDTGTCAVSGKVRLAQVKTPHVPAVYQFDATQPLTTPELMVVPLLSLADPVGYNLADFRTISALFLAAEACNLLSSVLS